MKLALITLAVSTFIPLYLFSNFFIIAVPTVSTFIVQFILYIVLDDLGFYTWHRTLHENQFLLRKIHVIHHRVRYPAPLEFIYVHPIEWMIGTIGIVVSVLLIIHIYGQANAYALWAYSIFRTLHELDIHSSTRSIIFRHVPFFGRVKHHDIHHLRAVGNYASTFTYLDKIF